MTTPNETGMAQQPAAAEAPVWQPPLSGTDAVDPIASPVAGDDATVDAPPATLPARARRAGSTTALLAIAAMVAFGGVGFAVGRATATGQSGTGQITAAAANGLPGAAGGGPALGAIPSGAPGFDDRGGDGEAGFGASTVSGTVVSTTSSSITLRLVNGQTVTVATGSSTAYHAQKSATATDVTVGASVVVQTSAVSGSASASSSPGAPGTRTVADVTITGK